jgi:hypothetical protein
MLHKPLKFSAALLSLLVLGACVTAPPAGPRVMALAGSGKTFEQFRLDDMDCRQYAGAQTGNQDANAVAADSTARSAALGTLIGAVAGAAINGNRGAAAGAGTGLLVGSMAGANAGQVSAARGQRGYDNAYLQCMYAKGNKVPVNGHLMQSSSPAPTVPSSGMMPPPPPPGAPPPAPPGQ